jgi:hypothetical protein
VCGCGARERRHPIAAAILEAEPAWREYAESVDGADGIVGSSAKRRDIGRLQYVQGFLIQPAGRKRLLTL